MLSNDCTRKESDKDVLSLTEEDVFSMLKSKTSYDQVNTKESQNFSDENDAIIASNELCAMIWDHSGDLNWFLEYLMKNNEYSIKIEQLEQVLANNNSSWRYLNYADIEKVENEQILLIKVFSKWNFSNAENFVLVLMNAVEIDFCFSKYTFEEYL